MFSLLFSRTPSWAGKIVALDTVTSCRSRPEHTWQSPGIDQVLIVSRYSIITDVGGWVRTSWGMALGENCTAWGGHITATHSIIVPHLHINWGQRHKACHALMCIHRKGWQSWGGDMLMHSSPFYRKAQLSVMMTNNTWIYARFSLLDN